MIFKFEKHEINTNLASKCYDYLVDGTWKIGLVNDNKLITDKTSNYYEDKTINLHNNEQTSRVFRNKINVKLIDGTRVNAHIIHWHPTNGYFCITLNNFWDQFD